mmetsp:Transcript_1943/g.2579  ORF Transcript_1943/g.2579 Transcript_1943/m.2579 type:complete len:414 (-) Transcript_1943:241-1482(-)
MQQSNHLNILLNLLVPEPPPGIEISDWVMKKVLADQKPPTVISLIGIVDNCSIHFPKASNMAIAVISLMICRRPTMAFALIDPKPFMNAMYSYLQQIFHKVSNSDCIVEEHLGVIALINTIPLLYHLGDWYICYEPLLDVQLPVIIATSIINIIHGATNGIHGRDSAPNLTAHPELINGFVFIQSLIEQEGQGENMFFCVNMQENQLKSMDRCQKRLTVLKERPMSFVVATLLEVLNKWAMNGIPITKLSIPVSDSNMPEPVSSSFQEYLPRLKEMVIRCPDIAYAYDIMQSLSIYGNIPSKLYDNEIDFTMLHQPLNKASMQCALSSCHRRVRKRDVEKSQNGADEGNAEDGGAVIQEKDKPLLSCSGGCSGLAQYCCKEHQKEHWPFHKRFCKMNGKHKKAFRLATSEINM